MKARKLFGTDGIRGLANQYPMTAEVALTLGRALTAYFKRKQPKVQIIIGKDTRRSGYMLETALTSGIASMGGVAYLLGPLPTPSVAYHIRGMRADGGVMISASHNPFEDNGLKVFDENGFKLSDELEYEIEKLMDNSSELEKLLPSSEHLGSAKRIDDALGRYLVNLKSIFPRDFDLSGMRIVFDGANGAAYDCGPRLLRELGAEVMSIACEPNGVNINKSCAQEDIRTLSQKVIESKADLGIGVDGDADRLLLVDETGTPVSGEHFMYEMALHLKESSRLKTNCLVTTSMANQALEEALQKKGIECVRTQVGDRYVSGEMRARSAVFGGETSGHFIFLDQNTTADGLSSALEVLALLRATNRKASSLRQAFELFPQRLINIPVKECIPLEKCTRLNAEIERIESQYRGKGRINIRYSGTQSVLRIMVEGPDIQQIERDLESVKKVAQMELSS